VQFFFPQLKKWQNNFQTTFFIQNKFGQFLEKEKKIKKEISDSIFLFFLIFFFHTKKWLITVEGNLNAK
jgi:hypothetical protein